MRKRSAYLKGQSVSSDGRAEPEHKTCNFCSLGIRCFAKMQCNPRLGHRPPRYDSIPRIRLEQRFEHFRQYIWNYIGVLPNFCLHRHSWWRSTRCLTAPPAWPRSKKRRARWRRCVQEMPTCSTAGTAPAPRPCCPSCGLGSRRGGRCTARHLETVSTWLLLVWRPPACELVTAGAQYLFVCDSAVQEEILKSV